MSASIRSSQPHFEKQKIPRFRCLDTAHISAIETLFKSYPFLNDRVEIHMPFSRAKPTFSSGTVWMWPKFDKRPVGYLIFMEGNGPMYLVSRTSRGYEFSLASSSKLLSKRSNGFVWQTFLLVNLFYK